VNNSEELETYRFETSALLHLFKELLFCYYRRSSVPSLQKYVLYNCAVKRL